MPSFLFLVVATLFSHGLCDMYSSIEDMKNLVLFEKDAAVELDNYIAAEEERLKKLRLLTAQYQQQSSEALSDPEHYVGNPINSYLLIKKLTLDWNYKVQTLLESPEVLRAREKVESVKENFPGYDDLDGAAAGILRLQDTYRLDPSHIAQGDLAGVKSTKLTAEDCFELGRYSYNQQDSYHCSLWMHESLQREATEVNKTISRAVVLDYLAYTESLQGNTQYALKLTNELLQLDPSHARALSNKAYYEQSLLLAANKDDKKLGDTDAPPKRGERLLDDYRQSEEFQTYEALCRGEDIIPNRHEHLLTCRYVTNNHPLLLLRPAKVEVYFLNPFVMMIHDSMSDREMDEIKTVGAQKLNRATVHNAATGKLETAFYRVSKSGWLKRADYPLVNRLRQRFEAISGLSFETGEDFQVCNYGLGGQYEPHFDYARKSDTAFDSYKHGNRIATWMVYMSDVEKGGATVFPRIGLKVFPKKGVSIFWYNLHKNGDGISNTRHAACPVLIGSKWVGNIWLHEAGNEWKRPCSLNPKE